jgi:hypothetical protein
LSRVYLFIYLFIYFCGIGVWTQGFMLARQALYHLSHSTSSLSRVLNDMKKWITWTSGKINVESTSIARNPVFFETLGKSLQLPGLLSWYQAFSQSSCLCSRSYSITLGPEHGWTEFEWASCYQTFCKNPKCYRDRN